MNVRNTAVETSQNYARNAVALHRMCGSGGFARVMKQKTQALSSEDSTLKFSAHAQARMQSRNIPMTPEMMQKLDKAVSGAEQKGSRESLVLLSDLAFIVNVQNRTVVTAMDGESTRERVFTNIDSTVIAG
jgi:flagellar operon protein